MAESPANNPDSSNQSLAAWLLSFVTPYFGAREFGTGVALIAVEETLRWLLSSEPAPAQVQSLTNSHVWSLVTGRWNSRIGTVTTSASGSSVSLTVGRPSHEYWVLTFPKQGMQGRMVGTWILTGRRSSHLAQQLPPGQLPLNGVSEISEISPHKMIIRICHGHEMILLECSK